MELTKEVCTIVLIAAGAVLLVSLCSLFTIGMWSAIRKDWKK